MENNIIDITPEELTFDTKKEPKNSLQEKLLKMLGYINDK